MRTTMQKLAATATAILFVAGFAGPASATCTRLGFTVNDYGKDGPTRDAKALLDKYIAKWAAEKGIKNFKTGPKNVKCELFLDFGVFDEHTCRAEASVCWDGPAVPGMPSAKPQSANAGDAVAPAAEQPKAAAKVKAKATAPENNASRTETGSTTKSEPAVEAAKSAETPEADIDAAKAAAKDAVKDGSAPAASTGGSSSSPQ